MIILVLKCSKRCLWLVDPWFLSLCEHWKPGCGAVLRISSDRCCPDKKIHQQQVRGRRFLTCLLSLSTGITRLQNELSTHNIWGLEARFPVLNQGLTDIRHHNMRKYTISMHTHHTRTKECTFWISNEKVYYMTSTPHRSKRRLTGNKKWPISCQRLRRQKEGYEL